MKVPADYERAKVCCTKCGHMIRIHEHQVKEGKRSTPKSKLSPMALRLTWAACGIAGMIGLLLIALSFRSEAAGGFALVFAVPVFLCALVWGSMCAAGDGASVGFDYLNLFGSLSMVIIIMMVGLLPLMIFYVFGYVLYLLFTQIQFAARRPGFYLPILLLEGIGLATMVLVPLAAIGREGDAAVAHLAKIRENEEADNRAREEFKAKNDGGPGPDGKRPPVKATGNPTLDGLMADMESGAISKSLPALTSLRSMPPNEHRAIVADRLAKLAKQTYGPTRDNAIQALSPWATSAEVPVLIDFLNTSQHRHMFIALARLKDPRSVKPIVESLRNGSTDLNASEALKKMGSMAEEEVLTLLSDPNERLQTRAIDILAYIGTAKSRPALQSMGPNNDAAKSALQKINSRGGK